MKIYNLITKKTISSISYVATIVLASVLAYKVPPVVKEYDCSNVENVLRYYELSEGITTGRNHGSRLIVKNNNSLCELANRFGYTPIESTRCTFPKLKQEDLYGVTCDGVILTRRDIKKYYSSKEEQFKGEMAKRALEEMEPIYRNVRIRIQNQLKEKCLRDAKIE